MKRRAIMWCPGRGPMLFGWLLFGHILPFVGFERVPCSWDGQPADFFDPINGQTDGTHTCSLCSVEWLGIGLTFGRPRDIRPA